MPGKNRTILIVDDDPRIQHVLAKRLKNHGFIPISAFTVAEGISKLKAGGIDLVLLDLGFVGADGADFLQIVKGLPAQVERPGIIVMSCYSDRDIIEYVIELGAIDFIAKPYDPARLMASVNEHLAV